jgi:hypothetical protein
MLNLLILKFKLMKTLFVILAMVIGTATGINAQTQTKAKPQTTTQTNKSQPMAQSSTQTAPESRNMIKNTELPKAIQDNLAVQFKGWTPTHSYRIDNKGVFSYEVMVKKEANEMKLFYDKDGKFLREEPVATMKAETKKEVAPVKQGTSTTPAKQPANKPK